MAPTVEAKEQPKRKKLKRKHDRSSGQVAQGDRRKDVEGMYNPPQGQAQSQVVKTAPSSCIAQPQSSSSVGTADRTVAGKALSRAKGAAKSIASVRRLVKDVSGRRASVWMALSVCASGAAVSASPPPNMNNARRVPGVEQIESVERNLFNAVADGR